jgi:selenocysteine-specific elongation factor
LSTAALDKNPQSQRRGITLDLGFSSFAVDIPEHLSESLAGKYDKIQFTLVDCPGHASLIRTIIGGAQIIDMIVLVIDINKGIQTQTAECIVIGEITTDKMIIVLNKVDMLPPEDRESKIEKMTNKIRKVFSATKFSDAPIVLTSAAVGGEKVASVGAQTQASKGMVLPVVSSRTIRWRDCYHVASKSKSGGSTAAEVATLSTIGIPDLMGVIQSCMEVPSRNVDGPFYFSIDHCFAIKGHGTVLTGAPLSPD